MTLKQRFLYLHALLEVQWVRRQWIARNGLQPTQKKLERIER